MPLVVLTVNNDLGAKSKETSKKLSELSSELLGKPEATFAVYVRNEPSLLFAGTSDPAFVLNINALGGLTPEANVKYCKAYFDFFQEQLDISPERGYIVFDDPGTSHWGARGTTVAELMAGPK